MVWDTATGKGANSPGGRTVEKKKNVLRRLALSRWSPVQYPTLDPFSAGVVITIIIISRVDRSRILHFFVFAHAPTANYSNDF